MTQSAPQIDVVVLTALPVERDADVVVPRS
jgi:hypothetical protein